MAVKHELEVKNKSAFFQKITTPSITYSCIKNKSCVSYSWFDIRRTSIVSLAILHVFSPLLMIGGISNHFLLSSVWK